MVVRRARVARVLHNHDTCGESVLRDSCTLCVSRLLNASLSCRHLHTHTDSMLYVGQFNTLMFAKLIGFGADDAGARAGAKPCSSPDTWTEACGTNQEMAQAESLYKAAPKDAWGATGGMPVIQTPPGHTHAHTPSPTLNPSHIYAHTHTIYVHTHTYTPQLCLAPFLCVSRTFGYAAKCAAWRE